MEQKGTLKYRKVQRTPQTGENAGKKKKWYATSVTGRSPRCITEGTEKVPSLGYGSLTFCF